MKTSAIGIFDSGYGGLTVMKEIIRTLPQYDYAYLGDNARAPYGNRSKKTICDFTDEAINFFFSCNAQLIIIACNTASALALKEMQEKYLRNSASKFRDRKILGVVLPIAEKAVTQTRFSRIGVIGTRGTVESCVFPTEIRKLKPNTHITQQACPLLVPLIEEHWHKTPEAMIILKKYLKPLKHANIDTLIPGCTHYPLMIKDIKRIMGKRVNVLASGEIIAESLKNYLERHPEIESRLTRGGERRFFTTDDPKKFCEFGKEFAGIRIKEAKQVSLIPTQS